MLEIILKAFPIGSLVFFSLFCLCVGSLLNVFIHRLPLMMNAEWTKECREFLKLPELDEEPRKVNLFFPRSFCPNCKKMIPFWFNIPLLSYIILKGRSHCCKTKISFQYPFVEGVCLFLSLLAGFKFGATIELVFALFFIWTLIIIAFIDLKHQIIPDTLSYTLLWLGLIANTQSLFTPLPLAVLSAVGAYLGLWGFIKLYYLISGKIGMGNGDFKLFAAFGAWFGWTLLPFILLLSSILGAVIGISYLKLSNKSKETPIPFGPFLCIAGLIALLYGQELLIWYLTLYH